MMRALIVSGDRFEDSELLVPYYRLLEAGAAVQIASSRAGSLQGKHGYRVEAEAVAGLRVEDFVALILPGGKAPAALSRDGQVLELVRSFMATGTTVAAICHGPLILAAAGVICGTRLTCYHGVAQEVKDAGGLYEDAPVVEDGNLITSRIPADLPCFMRAIMARWPG